MKPSMSIRKKQKAETRNIILNCARDLFSNKGFEVSMRTIAKEANVSVGTLFVHFKDKNDLLAHVLHEGLAAAGKRGLSNLSSTKSVLDNLIDVTKPVYSYYFENPRLSQVLLKESIFISEEEEDENQLIRDQLYWFLGEIMKIIQPRFKNDPILNIENFMSTFLSLYFINLLKHLKKDSPNLNEAMDDLMKPLRGLVVGYGLE